MPIFKLLGAVAILLSGMIGTATATPNKELYELQERCGKRAEETFEKQWGTGVVSTKDGQVFGNFKNHYSVTLNKCFYLETSTGFNQVAGKASSLTMLRLYDLNDNNEIGDFTMRSDDAAPMQCELAGKRCRSEAGWNELLKTYMEN